MLRLKMLTLQTIALLVAMADQVPDAGRCPQVIIPAQEAGPAAQLKELLLRPEAAGMDLPLSGVMVARLEADSAEAAEAAQQETGRPSPAQQAVISEAVVAEAETTGLGALLQPVERPAFSAVMAAVALLLLLPAEAEAEAEARSAQQFLFMILPVFP